mmetsp:Transcript_4386/g.10625  ORF Transcript_4386/g.10625 Transcript_4386/m.10625 type:complete len:215 (-) Transcript_4386:29-673(-)
MHCLAMLARYIGGVPWPPSRFFRSAKLPRSMNSSATCTALVFLFRKPAYHWTRCGHPPAVTRPLISFNSCCNFALSSTLIVLTATCSPVALMTPFITTPQAPAPKCEPASSSMSCGPSLYSVPSNVMPSFGDTLVPVVLWRIVPFASTDQVMDTEPSGSTSSISSIIFGGILARGVEGQRATARLTAVPRGTQKRCAAKLLRRCPVLAQTSPRD